jgi:small subunit ribosomal protein S1
MADDSFASLFANSKGGAGSRRLRQGEVVEVKILTIAGDTVFVGLGTPGDGRIPRAELMDEKGEMKVKVGDTMRATVVDPRPDGPTLTVSLGRGGNLDVSSLELAKESAAAVAGEVKKAVKGGLEVSLGGVHAFCPASQVELGFAADLEVYVGQTLEFRVIEIREGGRSIVVSRRALLEDRRREVAASLRETLVVGADVTGTVQSFSKHGAVIDLGGLEGFVHLSELAGHRVERAEDVLKHGETVTARVLSVEDHPKGLRVRLSLRALAPEAPPANVPDEVLKGTVSAANQGGLIVNTARGEGFLPLRELGLPPGADHRRAYPQGKELTVVITSNAGGKLRFSATQVSRVEERKNYQAYSAGGAKPQSGGGLGSLGDLLRDRLKPGASSEQPGGVVRRKR